jgi:hypothetical protein
MLGKGQAKLSDILLLFIYLEIGTMDAIYFKTTRLPVRCLIYIAMTALKERPHQDWERGTQDGIRSAERSRSHPGFVFCRAGTAVRFSQGRPVRQALRNRLQRDSRTWPRSG